MKIQFSNFSCLLILCTIAGLAFGESGVKEYVVTLDKSNFTDVVSKHNFIVVEFYAPWCGHCKKLAPEYEKAAAALSSAEPHITLAKVDVNDDSNKDLAAQFGIKGYPTIKILRDGGRYAQEYKGPREANGIVDYLKKQSGPASVEIKSVDDAKDLISDNKIFIVGVFPVLHGEKFEKFIAVAEKLRSEYEFGHTLNATFLPRGESAAAGPLVRLFKPFDELHADFEEFDSVALERFIEESSRPVVTIFNKDPSNHPFVIKFFNSPDSKAMLILNMSEMGELAESLKTKYREVANDYKGENISFLIGDIEATQGLLNYFGLKEDQMPLIFIQSSNEKKYLKPNIAPDDVAQWLKSYKEGKLMAYVKSAPIPETNDEPVKVVVADSLQDVFTSGKNVLLEFYAPWCGHCKKLAPILDEVAVSYEGDNEIVIAKFDGTANDIPSDIFEVSGYPTLFFRAADGRITQYEGNRTKEEIISFIEKNRHKDAQQEPSKTETDSSERIPAEDAQKESVYDEL